MNLLTNHTSRRLLTTSVSPTIKLDTISRPTLHLPVGEDCDRPAVITDLVGGSKLAGLCLLAPKVQEAITDWFAC